MVSYCDVDGIFHVQRHSEDEPRDDHGRWTAGGNTSDGKAEPLSITIKRMDNSGHTAYGRGMDNYRQPASYMIHADDGQVVGSISSSKVGYMGKASWQIEVASKDHHFRGRSMWPTLAEAKVAAAKGFYKK